MRRLRYQVATSLDGYIAGPDGQFDWIVSEPDFDFQALYAQFSTVVMGRKTFQIGLQQGATGEMPGLEVVVFSRTLRPADYPKVSIVSGDPARYVRSLKAKRGRDVWLFGGGELFRTLLDAGLVDTVEPAVMPVLLGAGIPMLPPPFTATKLKLAGHKLYPKSGMMLLEYAVRKRKRRT